jgi:hypothetical protein
MLPVAPRIALKVVTAQQTIVPALTVLPAL